jgi:predicted secreted hydrolase
VIESVTNRAGGNVNATVDLKSVKLRPQPHLPTLLQGRKGMHVKKLLFAGRLQSGGE